MFRSWRCCHTSCATIPRVLAVTWAGPIKLVAHVTGPLLWVSLGLMRYAKLLSTVPARLGAMHKQHIQEEEAGALMNMQTTQSPAQGTISVHSR